VPRYSYQCSSCSHQFELRQSFDSEPEQECPVCSNKARRLFHPVGVIYKGSGFYTTDYRKPASDSSETSASPSTSPSSSPSSSPSTSPSSSPSTDTSAPKASESESKGAG
jgi:putative FmdB family regulatory protein